MKKLLSILLVFVMMFSFTLPVKAGSTWDPDNGSYVINTLEDLKDFRDRVNAGDTFINKTVVLNADIDLASEANWAPIGNGSRAGKTTGGASFKGIFDGQGHTISNMTVSGQTGDTAAGFFGIVDGDNPYNVANRGLVKNLKFDNCTVNTPNCELTGICAGFISNDGRIHNVTISASCAVTGKQGVGGIVGRIAVCGEVIDCTNYGKVTGSASNVGGIVGAAYYLNCNKSAMTIKGCKNYGAVTGNNGVGGIVGLSAAYVLNCYNAGTVTDPVGGGEASVGGIVGEQQSFGAIKNCTNAGDVNNYTNPGDRNNQYGTGGIVGWVRYNSAGSGSYVFDAIIEVSGNTNTGSVYGGHDAGGIIGVVYDAIIAKNNTNKAASLDAGEEAAGIVGQFYGNKGTKTTFSYDKNTAVFENNINETPLEDMKAPKIDDQKNNDFKDDVTGGGNTNNSAKHNLVYHDGLAPTCTEEGTAAHYTCTWCHGFFDTNKNPISKADIKTADSLGHLLEAEWHCDVDEEGNELATGHHKECLRAYPTSCDRKDFDCDHVEHAAHNYGPWTKWLAIPGSTDSEERSHVCEDCGYIEKESRKNSLDFTITKAWDDDSDKESARPRVVYVTVYNGETEVTRVEITGEGNVWTYDVKGLQKYVTGSDDLITYTIEEDDVDDYATTIIGNSAEGFTITNTYNKTPENPDIPDTGDYAHPVAWLSLVAIATAGMAAMIYLGKKED